ncbi:hypothetical protein THRCLA_21950 [Thraustotheca clavata]|uniref:Glutamine cyclotransferase n=1 Tax=Thraustotheca clavata TaxID=74557 RepID=A0A1V9ZH67_9STRA|nr:hypothetical protein THRCLA_21950 [Thraustotheca clavata]
MGKKSKAQSRGWKPQYTFICAVFLVILGLWSMQKKVDSYTFKVPSKMYKLPSDPRVHVLGSYPHDNKAFTQGLLVESPGILIESTGLYHQSSVRRVNATSGDILMHSIPFPSDAFGEGIALNHVNNTYIVLTWQSQRLYVLDRDDFRVLASKRFSTTRNEGWGITMVGNELVVSDGSDILHFWDPNTLQEIRRVAVVNSNNQQVRLLNELEYAHGYIFANVWYTNTIVKINPTTGQVVQSYDLSTICTNTNHDAVLNGIAYDEVHDVFFVTGKLWDTTFLVKLN